MTVLAILPTLVLVPCLLTEASSPRSQTPVDDTGSAAELERDLRQVPDVERRLERAMIATMPAAPLERAVVWAARLDAVTNVLTDSQVPDSRTVRNLLEARSLDSDRMILSATVLARLGDEAGWRELCAARWRLKQAIEQTLAGLDADIPELGDRDQLNAARIARYTILLDNETREIGRLLVEGVDLRAARDEASLMQALSASSSARSAIWNLALGCILDDEILSLELGLPGLEEEGPLAYAALAKLERVRALHQEQYDRLAERCGLLRDVVRQNQQDGLRLSAWRGPDMMALMGIRYVCTKKKEKGKVKKEKRGQKR